jgi:LacI family gluconate utilization system Gnt-I transcriptional repressor
MSKGAKKTGRPTIRDVAAEVGVSAITVSRALRTPQLVSPALRERIGAAVQRLGYVGNRLAGNLSVGRSNVVAVVVPNLRNAFFSTMIDTLIEVLEPAGFQILVATSRYDAGAEARVIESVLGWYPAAIVLVGTDRPRPLRLRLRRSGVPVIETWDLGEHPVDALIGFSHHAVGTAIGRHLVEGGYRRIGFIGAALQTDVRAAARYDGFVAALRGAGLRLASDVRVTGLASVDGGCSGLAELLARAPDADAVFCSNDVLALGALFECHRRNVRIPDDLALAGFGDLDASGCAFPPLTTVRPPGEAIGRRAAELVLRRAQARTATRRRVTLDLGFKLVARESTRAAAGGRAGSRAQGRVRGTVQVAEE